MEMKAPSQERLDWLKARRTGIGGSDVAAILGLSTFKTALQVYMDKIAEGEPDDSTSEPAEWGNRLEVVVAEKFQENHPELEVSFNNSGILRCKIRPFMMANPDRMIRDEQGTVSILECKTANARLLPTWEAGEIPNAYQLQVQHYMAVLDLDFCWMACLVGGQRYFEFRVDRNQEIIDGLIQRETEFWSMVQSRTPPKVAAGDSHLIDLLYPTKTGQVVELPETVLAEIAAFEEAKINLKSCEEEKELRANRIKEMLAGAEVGMAGKYKVTWKETSRTTIDGDALRSRYPEIASQVEKTATFRRFEVRQVKEKKS